MANLPDSSRKLIIDKIDNIYERLRQRAMGPFYRAPSGARFHASDKILSIPGVYSAAYNAGPLKNQQPSFDNIQSLTSTTDAYLIASREKVKAKALAEIESQLKNASIKKEYDLEKELNEALNDIFDKAQSEAKQIVETEVHRAKTIGINDSVAEFAKEQGDEDPTVYALTRMDSHVCLASFEKVKLSSNRIKTAGELKIGDILKNPTHATQNGGNKILFVEKKHKKTIKLSFDNGKSITCTEDHPILVRVVRTKSRKCTYIFMEANRIKDYHDVIFQEELNSSDRDRITKAILPKEFMNGYQDSWDFWRKNIDYIIATCKENKGSELIRKEFNITLGVWREYVRHVILTYDPHCTFKNVCKKVQRIS